jgi:hypothetical protein
MDMPGQFEVFAIPLKLLRPINLLVMFFILLAHVVAQGMALSIAMLYLVLLPFWALWHLFIIAHFGNVIDETGPVSNDELPTPLRHLNAHDDIFGPMWRVIASLVLCHGPGLALLMTGAGSSSPPVILALSVTLLLVGTFLFPAAVLTMTTSGSVLNMRPDRIIGVAIVCGAEYFFAVCVWLVGGLLYAFGTVMVDWLGVAAMDRNARIDAWYARWYIAYGALTVGIYLMHYVCWHLGVLYRKHHQRFPWVLQRYFGKRAPVPPTGFPVARAQRGMKAASMPQPPLQRQPARSQELPLSAPRGPSSP